ncbi:UBX domain-containing family protein [Salix suchowensis]|nr:UBX domain-containing family protein [Salix suchowensis]
MARPNQEAIETFISITGATEDVAVQKLEEHGGDLNAAVNVHFSEGDRSAMRQTSIPSLQDDVMDIDDDPIEVAPPPRRNPLSILAESGAMNSFSLLDPHFQRGYDFMNRAPIVSQPRELREIPIEVKDESGASGHSVHAPIIEDVTGTDHAQGPGIQGTVIAEDDDISTDLNARATQGNSSLEGYFRPSAPELDNLPDYSNDIEEEMVRAAIEASKQEAQELTETGPQHMQPHGEDAELEHVVSLSLKTAEQERALHDLRGKVGPSEVGDNAVEEGQGKIVLSNGRQEAGSSSIQDEAVDVEDQPLIRHRSRQPSSGSLESTREAGVVESSLPLSPGQSNIGSHPLHNGDEFSDEWGGISSEEHDEAVMLEAAMFGGIPEGTGYRFPYTPHQFMQNENHYPRPAPRPPSPSLQAQRLIREQQDDEYLASLAADREKEMKVIEEAEARRVQEEVLRKAALEEEMRQEEESRRKLEEEKEFERLLAAKEASLAFEPASDDENAVTLLVRMPDGSRRGRRFLKSDKLHSLFDFIDIGRVVKPGTYRLVRPYPRRAFSDGESALTLSELGLTSKQEALFLELI